MTRINTNVSSLTAQKNLAKSNASLQQALTRLSTGLRINSGKDDPAGLIASEVLGADITATQKAISNTQRAGQMISTADSALGQISSLLNDIRGLVSEAANTGAMSAEQIAANQLQVDSSLEAIDRVSQVTQFQGRKLLDGNLDFVTEGVSNSQISNLNIDQANFGSASYIGVGVNVVAQAEKASLQYNSSTLSADAVIEVGGTQGYDTFSFASGSTVADMAAAINLVSDSLGVEATTNSVTTAAASTGQANISSTTGANGGVVVTADSAGRSAGNYAIKFDASAGHGAVSASLSAGDPNVITVNLRTSSWGSASNNGAILVGAAGTTLNIAADVNGQQFNGASLTIVNNNGTGRPNTATYDYQTNTITADVDVTTGLTNTNLVALINNQLGSLFTASVVAGGGNNVTAGAKGTVTASDGTDGGTLHAANTATAIASAIDGIAGVGATATGTGAALVNAFTHSATLGSTNAGLSTDKNNGIQLYSGDGAANLPITMATSGTNQSLSISFTDNTATGGYSTAYVQGGAANSTVKITAANQGTDYDGVTVSYVQSSLDRSVVYNKQSKTLTVYNDFNGGAVQAEDVIAQINASVDNVFVASSMNSSDATSDDGIVTAGLSGTTSGGNKYTGITVNLGTDSTGTITSTAADVIAAINASTEMQSLGISAADLGSSDGTGLVTTGSTRFTSVGVTKVDAAASGVTVNRGGQNAQMTVTAKNAGALYDGVKVVFHNDSSLTGGGDEYVSYNSATKELGIYIKSGTSTLNDVLDNFTSVNNPTEYALFSLTRVGTGTGTLYSSDTGTLTGGVVDSGTSDGGVALAENYDAGDVVGTGLKLTSTDYGSSAFVSVKALSGSFQMTNTDGEIKDRDAGADANVMINGVHAVSDGLNVSLNTAALDLSFNLDASVAVGIKLNFNITGGGAQFQLGPEIVSNQQARLGISSVSTAKLGGVAGRLFELRSGGVKSLTADVIGAARVVDEAITHVTNIRGRLGAFQSTTLDTNNSSLNDSLESLTAAQSDIRDADFATESANLTRAQILVQAGTSVLSIANQNPQNVLALLR